MGPITRIMLGLCVCAAAAYADEKPGAELTDPIEILRKADAAAKAVKAVQYKVSYKGIMAAEKQVPVMEGTVLFTGWAFNAPEKYRCDAKIQRPGSSEVREVTIGTDGETYYLMDHKAKKAHVDVDPGVIGSTGRQALALVMAEFVHPTPFNDEINGRDQTLKGSKKIGNEDCYEISLAYASAPQEAVWCFSKKDFLPRGVQRLRKMPVGGQGGQEWMLTDLIVDPEPAKDAFAFKLPEGYTQTDDFAP